MMNTVNFGTAGVRRLLAAGAAVAGLGAVVACSPSGGGSMPSFTVNPSAPATVSAPSSTAPSSTAPSTTAAAPPTGEVTPWQPTYQQTPDPTTQNTETPVQTTTRNPNPTIPRTIVIPPGIQLPPGVPPTITLPPGFPTELPR